MIDFVWNDVLLNPMINALVVLSHVLFDNFGLAIIAFTILIRGATYPLTRRQLRTTRAMQEMQPRLQEIQKKYKDPKRRQQEMMRVYREVGFNPLGCAVPLLVQLPIWIALFQVIRRTMSDTPEALLSLAGRLYEWDFITAEIPLNRTFLFMDLSKPSIPLVVLVGLATFYQQKMSTSRAASTGGEDRSANTPHVDLDDAAHVRVVHPDRAQRPGPLLVHHRPIWPHHRLHLQPAQRPNPALADFAGRPAPRTPAAPPRVRSLRRFPPSSAAMTHRPKKKAQPPLPPARSARGDGGDGGDEARAAHSDKECTQPSCHP